MDNMIVQTGLWIASGAVLIAYIGRRRKRKMSL